MLKNLKEDIMAQNRSKPFIKPTYLLPLHTLVACIEMKK
jgi:hypothetical protein